MPFIPHTPDETSAMLGAIGVRTIEDLFDEIPVKLRADSLPLHLLRENDDSQVVRGVLRTGVDERERDLDRRVPEGAPAAARRETPMRCLCQGKKPRRR